MKSLLAALLFSLICSAPCLASETIRLPATRDNSIVLVRGEEALNQGRNSRIRIKGNQHLVVLGFDTSALRGRLVESATLVCAKAEENISQVTVSTVQCDWRETKSSSLTSGIQKADGWGAPGTRFPAVTGGNSFSLVCHAKSVVRDGAYHWRIDPDLVHALLIDAAWGLTIHEVDADYGRNPTIWSKESKQPPYLLLTLADPSDAPAPAPPSLIEFISGDGDPENARLRLRAPRSGFTYDITVNGQDLPRWNIPFVEPRADQLIPVRDLGLQANNSVEIAARTVGRAGQLSKVTTIAGMIPSAPTTPKVDVASIKRGQSAIEDIDIIPTLDRYDERGRPIGDLPDDYRRHNAVFDGETIALCAARGEVIGFQALIKGKGNVTLKCRLPGIRTETRLALYVSTPEGRAPDPLIPFDELSLSPQRDTPVVVDVFVPFDFGPSRVVGELSLSDGRRLPIQLSVRDFTLPRKAGFLCEMNGYGLPDSVEEFYRLQEIAYDHRVHCNILHYSHSTAAAGSRKCTMDVRMASGRRMDEKRYNAIEPGATEGYWDDFVSVFGPFISGRHFKNGHRGAIPAPGFYLTFHESWPLNVRPYFNGNPDAYVAFDDKPVYAETFRNILRDFVGVAKREGWTEAGFQLYLNNKGELNDPRRAPWILDEPTAYWDYRALAWYGDLVRDVIGEDSPVRIQDRIDISRPQFDRGELLNKSDLWIVNMKSFRYYGRLVRDRVERTGEEIWVYGTSSKPEESSRVIQAWVLEAYCGGARGLVPWQTIDKGGSALTKGDTLGLFIFDRAASKPGRPVIHHSMRLKAYRRAQQDVEYLMLLQKKLGLSRRELAAFVDHYVNVDGATVKSSEADAGSAQYSELAPEGFRALREAVATMLSGQDSHSARSSLSE